MAKMLQIDDYLFICIQFSLIITDTGAIFHSFKPIFTYEL